MHNSIWFQNLVKPALQPPSWIFTPVWIILYGTLIASIIIYVKTPSYLTKTSGYIYYTLHLLLNLSWSPVFFGLHNVGAAFVIILLMDLTALFLITKFHSVSKVAGGILIPYLIWLLFATYLNLQFWRLN